MLPFEKNTGDAKESDYCKNYLIIFKIYDGKVEF